MLTMYRCTKTMISDFLGGTIVFTRDKLYQGESSATPGGEWAMKFTNDLNEPHLMTGDYLCDYFTKASDLEIMIDQSHQGDPCIYCGKPHDEVGVGPCPGRISQVEVSE